MKNLVIVILVVIVGWLFFSRPSYVPTETVTTIDTIVKIDTFKITKKGKDIPYNVLDTMYLIDEVHDTAFIVKDYSVVKAYSDTIYKDSNKFVINDTISQNKILSRGFQAYLTEKTIIKNNYIFEKQRGALYLGAFTQYERNNGKVGLGIGLQYKSPKNNVVSLSYSPNVLSVGYFKKIY